MAGQLLVSTLVVLAVAGSVACTTAGTVTPVYDRDTRALLRLDYDYDGNGAVDVRTYMRNGRPFRLEGDSNADGVTDRWEYYDANGQLERIGASTLADGREDTWAFPAGDRLRLDLSTRRDGVVDRREYYQANVLRRTESDTNHDGKTDLWEQYESGRLAIVLMDDDKAHDRPTRRLVYSGGAEPRVEIDPDGDGRFTPDPAGSRPAALKEPLHATR